MVTIFSLILMPILLETLRKYLDDKNYLTTAHSCQLSASYQSFIFWWQSQTLWLWDFISVSQQTVCWWWCVNTLWHDNVTLNIKYFAIIFSNIFNDTQQRQEQMVSGQIMSIDRLNPSLFDSDLKCFPNIHVNQDLVMMDSLYQLGWLIPHNNKSFILKSPNLSTTVSPSDHQDQR